MTLIIDPTTKALKDAVFLSPSEDNIKALEVRLSLVYPNEDNTSSDLTIYFRRHQGGYDTLLDHEPYRWLHGPQKDPDIVERPNFIFAAALMFDSIGHSGSKASRLQLRSFTCPFETVFEVYARDAQEIIYIMQKGIAVGRWTFVKRGQYYALKLYEALE